MKNKKHCFCVFLYILCFHKVQETKKKQGFLCFSISKPRKTKKTQGKPNKSLSSKPKILCQVLFFCLSWFCIAQAAAFQIADPLAEIYMLTNKHKYIYTFIHTNINTL